MVLEREYHMDWGLSDATALSSKLSKEVEELDEANILAILDSERQVDAVMNAIDEVRRFVCCGVLCRFVVVFGFVLSAFCSCDRGILEDRTC